MTTALGLLAIAAAVGGHAAAVVIGAMIERSTVRTIHAERMRGRDNAGQQANAGS